MTTRFLTAAYSRRPAPATYDPAWINVEMAKVAASMTSYVIRNVTTSTTLAKNDGMMVCNATGGAITVTLPLPSVGSGQPVTIKKSDATANAITIGGTVDGVLNRTLVNQNDSIVIQSDGTTWFRPMLTANGSGGTSFSLTAGTHLSGGPFNGTTAVTLVTDATELNTASTIVARDASGYFAATSVALQSLGVTAPGAGAGVNILAFSQLFTSAPWGVVAATLTGSITDPLGGTTAQRLTQLAADGKVQQPVYFTGDGSKSISVHLKYGNVSTTEFGVYDATAAAWACRFRATWAAGVPTISVVQGTGNTFGATSLGSGWYRCYGTIFSITAANSNAFIIYATSAGGGVLANYVDIWGAQAEDDAALSAYAATTTQGTAVTISGLVNISGTTSITGALSVSSTLGVTGVATFTAKPILSSLTASRAVFTDGSKGLVSNAVTGSGNVVMSAAPTLTGATNVDGITYTTALGSLTPYATPGAFTQTLSSQFASTVSGATLMGYGTTGDVTLKNRAGNDVVIVGPNNTDTKLVGKFGCNGSAPQAAYASGGALAAYGAGVNGFDTEPHASALYAMVVSIRAALVAAGVMS